MIDQPLGKLINNNDCKLNIRVPTIEDREMLLTYKKEWLENCSDFMNGACGLEHFEDINKWFMKIQNYSQASIEELSKNGKLRQVTYIALIENKIIGMMGIRPYLNKQLIDTGVGNIGYGVHPLKRKKGYGTEILNQGLQILRRYDVKRAVLGCYLENIGSRKVIEANGGILDKEWVDEEGRGCLRFYIDL